MRDETLVMTATFKPDPTTPGLVVAEEQERVMQYMCALAAWAGSKRVARVVFCENNNTDFDFSRVVRHLESSGKQVEVLVFDGNKDSARFGKGFGEGEILEHVYNHSRLLRAATSFYKITGRLFVENFDAISEVTTGPDAFQRKQPKDARPRPSKVVTTFFKCSLDLFERKLMSAYRQVDDRNGVFIEHVYYNELRDTDLSNFSVKPALIGQQASTGRIYGAYSDEVLRTAKSLARHPTLA